MKLQFEIDKFYMIDGDAVQLTRIDEQEKERSYVFKKIKIEEYIGEVITVPNIEKRIKVKMALVDYVNLKPEPGETIQIDGVVIYDGQKSRIKKLTRIGEMVELEVELV